jgi:hypothetical protein
MTGESMTNDEPADEGSEAVELTAAALSIESAHRLWLRAAVPILQARSRESDPSPRVQLALDLAAVAVCERIGRICRSDLAGDRG